MTSFQMENKGTTSVYNGSKSFRSQLRPLIFLTTIFFLNFISRIILAPLLPAIEEDLGLGHTESGSLFMLISIGYFVTLLGSGFLSKRITHKKTIILSAMAVGFSLLAIAPSKGLWGIRLALLLLGMSAGIYLPSGIAALTSLISTKHWGKAIAIHELAPNMSFVAAPLISEVLLVWFSWRGVLFILGCCSLLIGIAFARFGRGGEFPGQAPGFGSSKALFAEPGFWIMIILFSLSISSSLGVYAMLPLYLVAEQGMARHWANTLIALSRISGLVMALVAGWTSDHIGPRRTIGGVFLLTGIMTILLGVVSGSWIVVIVFLQPLVAVCFFPPGFAALSSIGPPSARNVAVSITISVAFILGAGAIPMGIGFIADAGSFAVGISLVGGLILLGSLLSLRLKLPK